MSAAMAKIDDGRRDFDFLHGRWTIKNTRLKRRLAGSTEWQELEATGECWRMIGGLGNVDTFDCPRYADGEPLQGMTVRVFDPAARLWSVYWADSRTGQLQPPVLGRFEGPTGLFFGDDTFDSKPIRVRFTWTVIDAAHAHWEQAFSSDGEKTWETNWRMAFTRAA